MVNIDPATQKILNKYSNKLASNAQSTLDQPSNDVFTKDYETFRNEAVSLQNTFYERACKFAGSLINVEESDKEKKKKVTDAINLIQIDITPNQSYSLAIVTMASLILLGFFIGLITFLFGNPQLLVATIFIFGGVGLLFPLRNYPIQLAQKHRLQASNQMVLCILYIVIYMRHTSNLEHAIKFAGEHIGNPLALDLRKVFWDVETKRFPNIHESLESYLVQWKDYNLEFIESIHLIESSLLETDNKRRIELLSLITEKQIQAVKSYDD